MPHILLVLGTSREGRKSEFVLRYIAKELSSRPDLEFEIVTPAYYTQNRTVPSWEEHEIVGEWRKKAERADAYIIISPEYNHGYPGELKMLLDGAYKEYFYKPVLFASVSDGKIGGARLQEHIRPVLLEMGMIPIKKSLLFFNADKLFSEDGAITDISYNERVVQVVDELLLYSKHLRPLREELLARDN